MTAGTGEIIKRKIMKQKGQTYVMIQCVGQDPGKTLLQPDLLFHGLKNALKIRRMIRMQEYSYFTGI
jgi:hypothetical protein